MTQEAATAKRSSIFDHPFGFWFFFCGGCAERCSYYGMRAILLLYMIRILEFEDGYANAVMSFFVAGCYLLPLAGGWMADKFLGNYRTIVLFSIPYVIGQGILGIASLHTPQYLYLSLGLLVLGSGMIKPNISTLMGLTYDQRRPGQTTLRSDAFALFYGSINIGSAVSMACVPWIRNAFGGDTQAYAKAFMFPTVLMALSLLIFAFGKPFYATETIQKKHHTPEERRERMAVLRRMLGLFLVVAVFWSIYDQAESTWVLFTRDYLHLKLDLVFTTIDLAPDQLQLLNPVLILIMLPPITMMWHVLARFGWDLKPTSKMLIGFVVTGIIMAVIAGSAFYGAHRIVSGAPVALAKAEQTADTLAGMMPRNAAAESASSALLEAVTRAREADAAAKKAKTDSELAAADKAKAAAKATLDASREKAKKTDVELVSLYCARNAAISAMRTARECFRVSGRRGSSVGEAEKGIEANAQSTQFAAKTANEAKDLAVAVAREKESKSAKKQGHDLTLCAVVAYQAEAVASAARSSMEAAAAGNRRAAEMNAAVACVDA
ncbi:MAG: MFS transporter, partial [Planctomycetaceae bacterium]|nr:MFS transporter [Planctomycetaceae bacterium]